MKIEFTSKAYRVPKCFSRDFGNLGFEAGPNHDILVMLLGHSLALR